MTANEIENKFKELQIKQLEEIIYKLFLDECDNITKTEANIIFKIMKERYYD